MESGRRMKLILNRINIQESIKTTRNMGKASLSGNQATIISEITRMIKDMVMVKCSGTMAQFTKEIGNRACSMDLARFLYPMGQ
jgi:hypothetical protein